MIQSSKEMQGVGWAGSCRDSSWLQVCARPAPHQRIAMRLQCIHIQKMPLALKNHLFIPFSKAVGPDLTKHTGTCSAASVGRSDRALGPSSAWGHQGLLHRQDPSLHPDRMDSEPTVRKSTSAHGHLHPAQFLSADNKAEC